MFYHEQEKFCLRKILSYIKDGPVSKEFMRAALITCRNNEVVSNVFRYHNVMSWIKISASEKFCLQASQGFKTK